MCGIPPFAVRIVVRTAEPLSAVNARHPALAHDPSQDVTAGCRGRDHRLEGGRKGRSCGSPPSHCRRRTPNARPRWQEGSRQGRRSRQDENHATAGRPPRGCNRSGRRTVCRKADRAGARGFEMATTARSFFFSAVSAARSCGATRRAAHLEPVPNATVHVEDTDCSFVFYSPPGWPMWTWLFPFNCNREEIASATNRRMWTVLRLGSRVGDRLGLALAAWSAVLPDTLAPADPRLAGAGDRARTGPRTT
jgi:hypothetical protein